MRIPIVRVLDGVSGHSGRNLRSEAAPEPNPGADRPSVTLLLSCYFVLGGEALVPTFLVSPAGGHIDGWFRLGRRLTCTTACLLTCLLCSGLAGSTSSTAFTSHSNSSLHFIVFQIRSDTLPNTTILRVGQLQNPDGSPCASSKREDRRRRMECASLNRPHPTQKPLALLERIITAS
jgi:hypothetical protein